MKNIDLLHVRIFRIFAVICCLSWHCVVVGTQVLERVGSLVPVIATKCRAIASCSGNRFVSQLFADVAFKRVSVVVNDFDATINKVDVGSWISRGYY